MSLLNRRGKLWPQTPPVRGRGKKQQSTSNGSIEGGRWLARERGGSGGGSGRGGSSGGIVAAVAALRWRQRRQLCGSAALTAGAAWQAAWRQRGVGGGSFAAVAAAAMAAVAMAAAAMVAAVK
jgi:hypothetical protein